MPGASAGVIYSPNFPWNYPKNISCDWLVTAPWGRIINLNFTIFNLESSSNGSCSDYVEVQYDFRTVKYCGSNIPSSITASGSIRVRFYSDLIVTSSGFMALYQTIKSFSTPSLSAASIYDCKPYSQNRKCFFFTPMHKKDKFTTSSVTFSLKTMEAQSSLMFFIVIFFQLFNHICCVNVFLISLSFISMLCNV